MVYLGIEISFPCCKLQLTCFIHFNKRVVPRKNPVIGAFPHKNGDMCITSDLKSFPVLILGFDVNKPLSFDENKMNKPDCGLK